MIKLIALDLDGTLLTSRQLISEDTAACLKEAAERGIYIVPATGRSPVEVKDYEYLFKYFPYRVYLSGALVTDEREGRAIASFPIAGTHAAAICSAAAAEDTMVQVMTDTGSFIGKGDFDRLSHFRMDMYEELYRREAKGYAELSECLAANEGKVLKVNIYHADREARERTRRRLMESGLELKDSLYASLECSAAGVDKAAGLSVLCGRLGISAEETGAVGDSGNDIDMLRFAGVSAAMGNASEEVKAAAGFVTESNDREGAADAVKRMLGMAEAAAAR